MFVGTVDYAAPEQIEAKESRRAADIYAFGGVLYECLTGEEAVRARHRHAVMYAHITEPPPSVSVRPELPEALDVVIARAMAKAAADRFGSCGELAQAARNAASGTARRIDGGTPVRPDTIASPSAPPLEAPSKDEVVAPTPEPEHIPKGEPWLTPAKQLLLTFLLVVLAATASGVVVYFLARGDQATRPSATPRAPANHPLSALVPSPVWRTCEKQPTPRAGALETAVCLSPKNAATFAPDRLELSTFASGAAAQRAYEAERRLHHVPRARGTCDGVSWGGEGTWLHNPAAPGVNPKPGGSRFCYFAGNDAVIVWTHGKFGQSTHTDLLGIARKGDSDHTGLFGWWRFWHHRLGKTL